MSDENPFGSLSDSQLVSGAHTGGVAQGAFIVETMLRLKGVLEREMQVANELSGKIHALNWALFLYTVALGLISAFQFGWWIRGISR
jgi:hypothetical protein